jgi:type II secretory pathway component PulF
MDGLASQKHSLYLEMAKFLRAGISIQKAVETLLRGRPPAFQTEALDSIQSGFSRGESVSVAFAALAPRISSLECTLIEAGEKSGTLGVAMEHLGEYFGLLAGMQKQSSRGLIYPAMLLHLAVFSQSIPAVFSSSDPSVVSNLATLLGPLPLLYAACAVLFLALKRVLALAATNAAIDRGLHMVPWVRAARMHAAMARFCRVYHGCVMAGMPVGDTLRASLDAAASGVLHGASGALFDCVKKGDLLGPAFLSEPAFPRMFSLVYSSGENAGTLDTDLQRLSEQFQAEAKQSMQAAGAAVPKLITFAVMGYAIYKIASFYGGYFSAMRALSE